MSSHEKYDFGSLEDFVAARALSLTALKPRPGGSIMPFCEPPTVTSTPHSSCRYSTDARDEIVSTSNKAGWPALSIALRTAAIFEVTPVEVSLCTTQTALMERALSSARA